jgi:Ca-activated chloride channel family protein
MKGDYEKAQDEFGQAAKKDGRPEVAYDLGAAAYKNHRFDMADEAFRQTLQNGDLPLQQQAYYGLGGARYRIGQETEKSDKKKTIAAWQQAVAAYEAALKLNPRDADAQFNRDFVKRKLEELQKQDQKDQKDQKNSQQNQNQSQDQKNDSQDKNSGSPQNQNQNQNGQQGQQPQPNGNDQKPNPSPGQGQDQKQSGQPQNPGQQPKPGDKGQQPAPSPGKSDDQKAKEEEGQSAAPGQMTKEEARSLLDAARGDEQKLPLHEKKPGDERNPEKDW